ncbi:MAG TPA: alpha/beta hydrolase [Phycicoccus sp.]|nr:alpha/beta hydrolase [Phycicoccus sp.]
MSTPPAAAPPRRRRRWLTRRFLVRFLVAFLVLNVVGIGAASWYYSDRIESDALHVHHSVDARPFTVAALEESSGAITLAPVAGDAALDWQTRDLYTPMVQGLYWDGGAAQSVTPAPALPSGPTDLILKVTLINGTWPAVGARIGSHTFAFPRGIVEPWQTITFPSPTGTLDAAFQPGVTMPASIGNDLWAVMVHGKGASPDEFTRLATSTTAYGLPTLAITYRGDDGMPPEPNDRYGFGVSEWPDLEAAIAYAVGQGAKGVVLGGASMGGAVVASFMRHAKDTSMVKAIILDAPALSFARTVQWGADQIALPGGMPLPAPVTWGAKKLSTWRFGVDWDATDYLTDPSWDTLPTLLFHGDSDLTVPVSTSREFAAARANVTYVEVKGAGHVASWNMDPGAYDRAVTTFLAKNLPRD